MTGKEKKELTAQQLQGQQRKIAKDLRKKEYSDIAIQGTNDYSIVSKRSVEKLYTSKINREKYECEIPQYFQNFVMKFQRRSPAINRGYWTRMEAIKQSSYKIIKDSVSKGKKVCIINLGAGYDPLAFQYLDTANPDNFDYKDMLSFIDVDYPDLNKIKIQMINNSQQLSEIIGEKIESSFQGVDLSTKNYTALSCDLKNLDLFTKQLEYLNLADENITKIFIAEVSIAYMLPQYADPVIKATSQFSNTHFLLLEQLLPAGEHQAFARTMQFHFNKLNSPLNSVTTYPTIEKQLQRFSDLGYKRVGEALDLEAFWKTLPKALRDSVKDVEAFDEWEEFILFAQHYLILHASNDDLRLFNDNKDYMIDSYKVEESTFSLQPRKTAELERKFLAAEVIDDSIIINGGASTSRLNSTLSTTPLKIQKHQLLARQAHSLVSYSQGLMLIGGRTSPSQPLSDIWILNKDGDQHHWNQLESMPSTRTRHSPFKFGNDIYVYGGNFNEPAFLKFSSGKWINIDHTGSLLSLSSAAVAMNGPRGVVIGGMNSQDQIESSLHVFEINGDAIETVLLIDDPLLNRYGAKAQFISEDELLLFGGVSDLFLFDQTTSIVKINIKTKEISRVKINDEIWRTFPLLVGFQLLKFKNRLITVGGGAVCYSFGSVWNDMLILGDDLEIPPFELENIV